MFDNTVSLKNVLVSLESTLKLEYQPEQKVEDIINVAVANLENACGGCTFDKDIFSLQGENQLVDNHIQLVLKDLQQCLAMMSFYIELKIYNKNLATLLSDVNYLGYGKDKLLTSLRYMQDAAQYTMYRDEVITPLYNALNNVPICTIKRAFIIMLMLDRLGVSEGVGIMAQFLFLGGL